MKTPSDFATRDLFDATLFGPTAEPKWRKPRAIRHVRPPAIPERELQLQACVVRLRAFRYVVTVTNNLLIASKWGRTREISTDDLAALEEFVEQATGPYLFTSGN